MDWLRFFILSAYATSAVGAVLSAVAAIYFFRKGRSSEAGAESSIAGEALAP